MSRPDKIGQTRHRPEKYDRCQARENVIGVDLRQRRQGDGVARIMVDDGRASLSYDMQKAQCSGNSLVGRCHRGGGTLCLSEQNDLFAPGQASCFWAFRESFHPDSAPRCCPTCPRLKSERARSQVRWQERRSSPKLHCIEGAVEKKPVQRNHPT